MKQTQWRSLADLQEEFYNEEIATKTLAVRTRLRTYLNVADAIYDIVAGHDLLVTDNMSCFEGSVVSVADRSTLRQHGYDKFIVQYNNHGFTTVDI